MVSKLIHVLSALCLGTLLLTPCGYAWDVVYDGNVLPDSTMLGSAAWQCYSNAYSSDCSAQNGLLHMVDSRTDATVRYFREGDRINGAPGLTVEARVNVVSASPYYSWDYAVGFGGSTDGGGAYVGLWPDKIGTRFGADNNLTFHSLEPTGFHVVRLAIDSNARTFTVWVDKVQVFAGNQSGSGLTGGVWFGTSWSVGDTAEAYWDYVAYSKQFLPVPEPSSILALAGGMAALGGLALRRKRS